MVNYVCFPCEEKKMNEKKNYIVDMRRLKTLRRIHLFYPCEDNRTQSCKFIDNWYPVISRDGLELIGDYSREDGKENGGYTNSKKVYFDWHINGEPTSKL